MTTYGKLLTEREFQRQVTELARLNGWRVYSIPDSRKATQNGYPDLTLWHAGKRKFILAELKTAKGIVSDIQKSVHAELTRCGVAVYVWRPGRWDEIEEVLGKFPE